MTGEPTRRTVPRRGRAAEVFALFLRLGLTSFGGPTAHLGYFPRRIRGAPAERGPTKPRTHPRGAFSFSDSYHQRRLPQPPQPSKAPNFLLRSTPCRSSGCAPVRESHSVRRANRGNCLMSGSRRCCGSRCIGRRVRRGVAVAWAIKSPRLFGLDAKRTFKSSAHSPRAPR
jgi:hypothetical protein